MVSSSSKSGVLFEALGGTIQNPDGDDESLSELSVVLLDESSDESL